MIAPRSPVTEGSFTSGNRIGVMADHAPTPALFVQDARLAHLGRDRIPVRVFDGPDDAMGRRHIRADGHMNVSAFDGAAGTLCCLLLPIGWCRGPSDPIGSFRNHIGDVIRVGIEYDKRFRVAPCIETAGSIEAEEERQA